MNTKNNETGLREQLLYIDKTEDKHYIDKIVELYEEGIDEPTLESIFKQRYEIEDWLRDKSLEGKDYTILYKENEKGKFRSITYKTDAVKQVWLSTLVDEDEDVTINMPTSFQEAHMLGVVGWCYCDNDNYWLQHTNSIENEGCGEAIYFIHNVLQSTPDDYVTDMVKPNGNHEILNRVHHHLDVSQYLKSMGNMANRLLPVKKNIKESNTHKNMKKNTIKLNEQQLRKVIAESIKSCLMEAGDWHSTADMWKQAKKDRAAHMEDTFLYGCEPSDEEIDTFNDLDKKVGDYYRAAEAEFEAKYGAGSWDETRALLYYFERHPLLGKIFKSGKINDAFRDFYKWENGEDYK